MTATTAATAATATTATTALSPQSAESFQPVQATQAGTRPDVVVTAEAVALEALPATAASRLLSGAVDYGIYALGATLSLATIGRLSAARVLPSPSEALLSASLSLTAFTWVIVVPVVVEVLCRGRSAGRLVTGTRVVRDDGGSLRLRHSLVRALVSTVEIWGTGAVLALVSCVMTGRGKRLGDLLAGTYVVRDHYDGLRRAPLLMPPELAAWAADADLRRLPGHLTLVTHTFLQRSAGLREPYRRELGTHLATQVSHYVSPPPPPGTHPERFLAAVLVQRRDRELALELGRRHLEETVRHSMARLPFEVGSSDVQ
ncbi:RDD family protein [Actinomyces wuliandei]|uniref:RDD family protein n=1 Tax=Actinomyces wuliandei TaxID=2057743 RepID=UPI000FDC8F23|nr:RDD family protein [Actinomyces wuliandei]